MGYEDIPKLMDKWCQVMNSTGRATQFDLKGLNRYDKFETFSDRAYAVGALLNPSCPWKLPVCLEIRPALLACRNDYDRLHLVHTALKASLQHIAAAGDNKMF